MEVHVLNGDALADKFPIDGQVIVCRECLIEGPILAESLHDFWHTRSKFIASTHHEKPEVYFKKVKSELEKLANLNSIRAINLWFEHDLFCQVNMWFVLHLLCENNIQVNINRVMPPVADDALWSGFGRMGKDALKDCYTARVKFQSSDIQLGNDLWQAYKQNDFGKLQTLSVNSSSCYVKLNEICEAHIQRFIPNALGRPQQKLKTIIQSGVTDFTELFNEFLKTESVYGFGDVQVKNMLENLSTKSV